MNVLGGLGCMSGEISTKGSTNIIVDNGVMKIEVKNEIVEDTKVTGYDMNPLFKKVIESLVHESRDQLAITVAKILMNEWFFNFGIPNRIHSDMGRNFVSAVVREICSSFGIKRSTTTPYHPMGNSQVESFNRTLLGLIRTLSREKRGKWSIHLNKLIHSYNTMPHTSTGYSSFYLMFNREDRIPTEETLVEQGTITTDWVREVNKKYREVRNKVNKSLEEAWNRRVEDHNGRARSLKLDSGDLVRIKERVLGRRKLSRLWSEKMWRVVRKFDNIEAYEIRWGDDFRVEHRTNIKLSE